MSLKELEKCTSALFELSMLTKVSYAFSSSYAEPSDAMQDRICRRAWDRLSNASADALKSMNIEEKTTLC
jgi:hypothetical protein